MSGYICESCLRQIDRKSAGHDELLQFLDHPEELTILRAEVERLRVQNAQLLLLLAEVNEQDSRGLNS